MERGGGEADKGGVRPYASYSEYVGYVPKTGTLVEYEEEEEKGSALESIEEPEVKEEDDYHFEDDYNEVQSTRVKRAVAAPSPDMIARHKKSGHCPYRSWCEDCIRGAANIDPHMGRSESSSGMPEFHSDYGFFRDGKRDKKAKVVVLVSRDRGSSGVCAHVCPVKGVGGGWMIQQYERDLRKFGHHGKIVLRTDGEPAIKDLVTKVAKARSGETVLEQSPVGDSRANGRAERAMQVIEKQTRVIKIATERRLGCRISVLHPSFPWLVMHAADVVTKLQIHRDGRTAYERIKGRPYSGHLEEFGIVVLYKVSAKVEGGVMQDRWQKGVWLGKRFTTDEHIIGTADGSVVRSVNVKAHPEEPWSREAFDTVKGAPWNPSGTVRDEGPEDIPMRSPDAPELPRAARAEPDPKPEVQNKRATIILRSYLEDKFGYTAGCSKCNAIKAGDETQPTLSHSKACRSRIEGRMMEDPILKHKVLNAQRRKEEAGVRKMEAQGRQPNEDRGEGEDKARREAAQEELPAGPSKRRKKGTKEGEEEVQAEDQGGKLSREDPLQEGAQSSSSNSPWTGKDTSLQDESVLLPDQPRGEEPGGVDVDIPLPEDDGSELEEYAPPEKRARVEAPLEPEDRDQATMESVCRDEPSGKSPAVTAIPKGKRGKYDLCEMFSPARATKAARARGLRGGWSMDSQWVDPVTNRRWNLGDASEKVKAIRRIEVDKPAVIGLNPPCATFLSHQYQHPHHQQQQQHSNSEPDPREWERGVNYVDFCMAVARRQMAAKRHFYFEHPLRASSWQLDSVRELMECDEVYSVTVHRAAMEPTRVITSLSCIAEAIGTKCTDVLQSVLDGIDIFLRHAVSKSKPRDVSVDSDITAQAEDMMDDMCESEPFEDYNIPFVFRDDGVYVDDNNGQELPTDLVRQARADEIEGFKKRCVYVVRPRSECQRKGLKPIGVRWVDILKNGRVRSRLVCQDINRGKRTDEMFSPTPPLLASKWLVSLAASQGLQGLGDCRILSLDFTKAFLYGDVERDVFIELPDEDFRKYQGDLVGYLSKAMYGLREAPQIWQKVVNYMLVSRGFKAVLTTQCLYYNASTGIYIVAHVDDFLCYGSKVGLRQLLKSLQSEFECDGVLLGPGRDEQQEITFIGRRLRWTPQGLEWESNVKHADSFVEKLGLSSGKPVETPGVSHDTVPVDATELKGDEATNYRGLAALANYLSQDRPDIAYASKEVSRAMSAPSVGDLVGMKRLGRYLIKHPRCVLVFRWQPKPGSLTVMTDSDWGGCQKTRKSTSGGCLFSGGHLIHHWSRTQQVVALSSAEAELNAICKAAQEGLGTKHMSEEVNMPVKLTIFTDSSAARGIIRRQGAGRIKHLSVRQLWVQQQSNLGSLVVEKVPREFNPSDVLTHHWTGPNGERMFQQMGVERRSHDPTCHAVL